jgi:HPt (histidine-containing phosphotransfer) domain-containing protein
LTTSLDRAAVTALRESVCGDAEFLAELVGTFLDASPAQLAALEAAAARGDAAEVRRVAHTLKSNAATFGMADVEKLCRELEGRAHDGDLAGADSLVAAVRHALADARPALQSLAGAA